MMRRHFVLVLFCTSVFATLQGQTTPASPSKPDTSQEAVVYERVEDKVRFEDDGSGVYDTTAVIRVQSQAGVPEFGPLVFGYSSATESLKIDYVRVRKPDATWPQPPEAPTFNCRARSW